jgi:2-keto-4-pentenoate hydratase/2-oxohepta-3-ene-1,7-dioic acid hydratase in catechol pathway
MAFRLGNSKGRAVLVTDAGHYDLEKHAGGDWTSDPLAALARFGNLHEVAANLGPSPDAPLDLKALSAPVPRPGKIFGIGLNYRKHAEESGMELGNHPPVFAKFPNCITGPQSDVILFGPTSDWEAELVVVMGTNARDIPAAEAWEHVAGLTCGQDISERATQFHAKPPHFDLGKSFDTFGPIGPVIVSLDQFANPANLAITCDINGERKQDARTDDLIFDIPTLIAYLSGICTLEPGDLIFTGTPSGVGAAQGQYLKEGDTIITEIEGIGTMTNHCVAKTA